MVTPHEWTLPRADDCTRSYETTQECQELGARPRRRRTTQEHLRATSSVSHQPMPTFKRPADALKQRKGKKTDTTALKRSRGRTPRHCSSSEVPEPPPTDGSIVPVDVEEAIIRLLCAKPPKARRQNGNRRCRATESSQNRWLPELSLRRFSYQNHSRPANS